MIKRSEKFSTYSHLAGAVFMVAGTLILVINTIEETNLLILSLIYGLSVVLSMGSSALYHSQKKEENSESIYRKLDHLAIFFNIAGSFSVFLYLYLSGTYRIIILTILWASVIAGVVFKLVWFNAPRILSTIVYGAFLAVILVPIARIADGAGTFEEVMLISCLVAVFTGGVIYALKKPDPIPDVFGFHEIFHIFILVGVICMYIAVYLAITKFI